MLHPNISHIPIQIHPTPFLNQISRWPSTSHRVVVSVSVVVETGFLVDGFDTEFVGELVAGVAVHHGVADGVVLVGAASVPVVVRYSLILPLPS